MVCLRKNHTDYIQDILWYEESCRLCRWYSRYSIIWRIMQIMFWRLCISVRYSVISRIMQIIFWKSCWYYVDPWYLLPFVFSCVHSHNSSLDSLYSFSINYTLLYHQEFIEIKYTNKQSFFTSFNFWGNLLHYDSK